MGDLARLRSLSPARRRLLLAVAVRLTWARVETAVVPFRRIAERLGATRRGATPTAEEAAAHLDAVVWSTRVLAARLPWGRNCLAQALAAKRYLDRRGVDSTLYLGVAAEETTRDLEAHAWIEASGEIVTGAPIDGYEVIYSRT